MKRQPEMVEGPEAWKRFKGVMKNILSVPHSKIQQPIKEKGRKAVSGLRRKAKPSE